MTDQAPQSLASLDLIGLAKATSAAAIAAQAFVGRMQKEEADLACVNALRSALQQVDLRAQVIIGEGEKDEAPALYRNEQVGGAKGIASLDMAVDPLEGTTFCAKGLANSFSVIAFAQRGAMLDPGPAFYMDKIALSAAAASRITPDLELPEMLETIAASEGKPLNALNIFILERPRNQHIIDTVLRMGARVSLHQGGDILAALSLAQNEASFDALLGIGGAPEGYLSAAALKAVGCGFFGRFSPQSPAEQEAVTAFGLDCSRWYSAEELIKGDTAFVATAITQGQLAQAPFFDGEAWITDSLLFSHATGAMRLELQINA